MAPSIAVRPFANLSAERENEYFGDDLAEDIINALAQVEGLKMIARTSAFSFKGKNEDVRNIALVLGVTNVLEKTVRRAGDQIRVTAQLIAAADGNHLWSERYDRPMRDVFAMQDEIASSITNALQGRLGGALASLGITRPACRPTRHFCGAERTSPSSRRTRGTGRRAISSSRVRR